MEEKRGFEFTKLERRMAETPINWRGTKGTEETLELTAAVDALFDAKAAIIQRHGWTTLY